LTDEEFKHNVALAKSIVSEMYSNWSYLVGLGFKGDEFNVYRALRSINPSPYLFFDYGDFKMVLHLKHKLL
jgi:anthranilate synthase component 1